MKDHVKEVDVSLEKFINKNNEKYFKLFNSVRSDFYFKCPDEYTFIMSRRFIAKYDANYNSSNSLETLKTFISTNNVF